MAEALVKAVGLEHNVHLTLLHFNIYRVINVFFGHIKVYNDLFRVLLNLVGFFCLLLYLL